MTKIQVFIPEITGKDLVGYMEFVGDTLPIMTLSMLLCWRTQLSVILSPSLPANEIQALESAKFLAKALDNSSVKKLMAYIALNRTLGFELENLKGKSKDEIEKHIQSVINELVDSPPPRGAKLLPPRELNSLNIKSHRYAIMAQLRGFWQARPIHEPSTVIRGGSIASIDMDAVVGLTYEMLDKLFTPDTRLDTKEVVEMVEKDIGLIPESYLDEDQVVSSSWNAEKHLDKTISDCEGYVVFNDGINFGNKDNKTPIETSLGFCRPLPAKLEKIDDIPADCDPTLLRAIENRNEVVKAKVTVKTSKTKPIKPASAASTPVVDSSPNPSRAIAKQNKPSKRNGRKT